jgi:glycosyltransferase involved in cell wall biosynthesis
VNTKFAGFIMTYERPEILKVTINKLFTQSYPPEKLLIIDNSDSETTYLLIKELRDSRIVYHRTGSNIGPAGASKIGLEILANEGYDWIYWGDDDDPPHFNHVFKTLLDTAKKVNNVGVVGAVGNKFNKKNGTVLRTLDQELQGNGYLEVDVIAGNVSMIVSKEVVKRGVLPDPRLFLNVEEYDFCLRAKSKGFNIIVDCTIFKQYREFKGRLGLPQRPKSVFPKYSVLWRRYYSTRNTIYILRKNEKSLIGALNVSTRAFVKMILGFKNGWNYGTCNFSMEAKGIYHGWRSIMGITVQPNRKY